MDTALQNLSGLLISGTALLVFFQQYLTGFCTFIFGTIHNNNKVTFSSFSEYTHRHTMSQEHAVQKEDCGCEKQETYSESCGLGAPPGRKSRSRILCPLHDLQESWFRLALATWECETLKRRIEWLQEKVEPEYDEAELVVEVVDNPGTWKQKYGELQEAKEPPRKRVRSK